MNNSQKVPDAPLAQLVEQLTLNQWVQGSSPWEDTKDIRAGVFFLYYACRFQKKAVSLHANCITQTLSS